MSGGGELCRLDVDDVYSVMSERMERTPPIA